MARWALVSGPKRSPRAEVAIELARALETANVPVGGFVQVKRVDAEDRKHYDLLGLRTGERLPLAFEGVHANAAEDEHFCSLTFQPDAFATARAWIERDARDCGLLVVGDVSKLEVAGGGHDATIRRVLALPDPVAVLLCVRADQLFYVVERYGLSDDVLAALEMPVDEGERRRFVVEAARAVRELAIP